MNNNNLEFSFSSLKKLNSLSSKEIQKITNHILMEQGGTLSLLTLAHLMAPKNETSGFIGQRGGRIVYYTLRDQSIDVQVVHENTGKTIIDDRLYCE